MASLGRRVLGVPLLTPVTWALTGRKTHLGERKRTASVLRKRTLASGGRIFEELPCVGPKTSTKEPERRTGQVPGLLEERTPLEPEVISSLLDMGFSGAQARGLLSVQPGTSPRQLLGIVSQFILLGLNPEPVCVALKKSPQLLRLPVTQMKKRSSYLRRLGLEEGKLKRVIYCCPEVFSMRQQDIDVIVRVLKEKCLFTVRQVTQILHRCPYVLREDPGELEYKFQYAYFRMGIQHPDLVKTELLQYSLTKIKQRHIYLERLGRYQTPDRKGQTQVSNPPVKHILRLSEAEFLARTARSSAEEFEVFKQLLAREEEGLEGGMSDDETAGLGGAGEEDQGRP